MASNGTVPIEEVWAMLKACAPGHTKKETDHNWRVMYEGQTYPNLSKGKHGRRQNPDIQVGQVKQMVRLFGIEDCAKKNIARLR